MGKSTATAYGTLVVRAAHAAPDAFGGSAARRAQCARCEHFVNFRSTLTWQRDIGTGLHAVRCARFADSRCLPKFGGLAGNELARFGAPAAEHYLPSLQQPSERAAP